MKKDPKIIVALDYGQVEPVRQLVQQLTPELCRVKIGNILFTRYGPALVEELMQQGFEVFLDLKFHDIPQTVMGACRSAAELGVWMVNIHVSSGVEVMQAAANALQSFSRRPLLIGVTVLTSLVEADWQKLGIEIKIPQLVMRMAQLAKTCGLDGVVCSALEVAGLRAELGDDFILVTPGIRLSPTMQDDDQKRTMTPAAALQAGANYLVIGRPITSALNPLAALQEIIALMP